MDTLRLTSSNSDAVVEFSDVEGDYFRVSVIARDHSATRTVYAYTDGPRIAAMFAEAAREWRGWNGAKVWESIEGELRLELSMDRLGHVTLAVRMRSEPAGPDEWQLEADIGLEAGQLDRIAREAHRLWSGGG